TPLAEVIKTVERKYNVHFHVQSPEALNFSYTLTTKQLHLEDLLNELQKIAPVKFQYKGDNVFVSI
ncbi:MAG TPA: anti-sigma factor, partial [Porphyromonadaceae bacterium]|nr:anti-sigma factor [Porphyromonadaceae bacterium]